MTPEDMQRMKDMIRDLNKMMQEKMQGGEPAFNGFMDKYGDLFWRQPAAVAGRAVEHEHAKRQMCMSDMSSATHLALHCSTSSSSDCGGLSQKSRRTCP